MACSPSSNVSFAPHAIGYEIPALFGVQRSNPLLLGSGSALADLKVTPPSVDTWRVQVPAWKSPSDTRTWVASDGSTAMPGMLSSRPRLVLSCVTHELAVTRGNCAAPADASVPPL